MNYMIFASMILLAAYIATACSIGRRIPETLSRSVFAIGERRKWIWIVVIVLCCALIAPAMYSRSGDQGYLAHFALFGMLLVGAAPLSSSMKEFSDKIHTVGAYLCAFSSQTLVAIQTPVLLFAWTPFIVALIRLRGSWRTAIFFAELTCFAVTYAYCVI